MDETFVFFYIELNVKVKFFVFQANISLEYFVILYNIFTFTYYIK
jgi:hypothetical protein